MSVIDLLRADGSIIVNKKLAHAVGIDGAIMYSELISKQIYFENRQQLTDDGYFFNTVDNMEEDTILTKYQQSKALRVLTDLGLVLQENRGLPQRRHFKVVNNDKLLLQTLETGQLLKNKLTSSKKDKQLEVEKMNSNNTNSNITKVNNTKSNKRNTITSYGDILLDQYNYKYREKFGEDHPTITLEQLEEVSSRLHSNMVELELDEEEVFNAMDWFFDNSPEKKDFKIFTFIGVEKQSALYRCDVEYKRHMEEMEYEY